MTRTYSEADVIVHRDGRAWVEDHMYAAQNNEPWFVKRHFGNRGRPFPHIRDAMIWLWARGAIMNRLIVWVDHDEYDLDFYSPPAEL